MVAGSATILLGTAIAFFCLGSAFAFFIIAYEKDPNFEAEVHFKRQSDRYNPETLSEKTKTKIVYCRNRKCLEKYSEDKDQSLSDDLHTSEQNNDNVDLEHYDRNEHGEKKPEGNVNMDEKIHQEKKEELKKHASELDEQEIIPVKKENRRKKRHLEKIKKERRNKHHEKEKLEENEKGNMKTRLTDEEKKRLSIRMLAKYDAWWEKNRYKEKKEIMRTKQKEKAEISSEESEENEEFLEKLKEKPKTPKEDLKMKKENVKKEKEIEKKLERDMKEWNEGEPGRKQVDLSDRKGMKKELKIAEEIPEEKEKMRTKKEVKYVNQNVANEELYVKKAHKECEAAHDENSKIDKCTKADAWIELQEQPSKIENVVEARAKQIEGNAQENPKQKRKRKSRLNIIITLDGNTIREIGKEGTTSSQGESLKSNKIEEVETKNKTKTKVVDISRKQRKKVEKQIKAVQTSVHFKEMKNIKGKNEHKQLTKTKNIKKIVKQSRGTDMEVRYELSRTNFDDQLIKNLELNEKNNYEEIKKEKPRKYKKKLKEDQRNQVDSVECNEIDKKQLENKRKKKVKQSSKKIKLKQENRGLKQFEKIDETVGTEDEMDQNNIDEFEQIFDDDNFVECRKACEYLWKAFQKRFDYEDGDKGTEEFNSNGYKEEHIENEVLTNNRQYKIKNKTDKFTSTFENNMFNVEEAPSSTIVTNYKNNKQKLRTIFSQVRKIAQCSGSGTTNFSEQVHKGGKINKKIRKIHEDGCEAIRECDEEINRRSFNKEKNYCNTRTRICYMSNGRKQTQGRKLESLICNHSLESCIPIYLYDTIQE